MDENFIRWRDKWYREHPLKDTVTLETSDDDDDQDADRLHNEEAERLYEAGENYSHESRN